MKLSALVFFVFIGHLGFAEANTGFQATWYCPTENRGQMPLQRDIEISYNDDDELIFKPNIFKMQSPESLITKILGSTAGASTLKECLKSFQDNLKTQLAYHQSTTCAKAVGPLCDRKAEDLLAEMDERIKSSKFYEKYRAELTGEVVAEDVPVEKPKAVESKIDQGDSPVTPIPNPTQSSDEERAQLLDLMLDHSKLLSNQETQLFSQHCPQLSATPGINSKWCEQEYKQRAKVLSSISHLLTKITESPVSDRKALSAVACLAEPDNYSDINNLLNAVKAKDDCEDLAPGEYKSGDYLLKRLPDGNYEATVIAQFNYKGGNLNSAQMKAKVDECMDVVAPHLRNQEGETLKIRVMSPEEAATELKVYEKTPVRQIDILPRHISTVEGSKEVRGSTMTFHDGMGCSTYAHEFLHHIGLWDEYAESSNSIQYPNSRPMKEMAACRVVPKTNTIMNNSYKIFQDTIPTKLACQCADENCRRALRNVGDKSYYADLLASQSPSEIMSAELRSKCKSTFLESNAKSFSQPKRKILVESQISGSLLFEYRQVSFNKLDSPEPFNVARYRMSCSCGGDSECSEKLKDAAKEFSENRPLYNMCPYGFNYKKTPLNEKEMAINETSSIQDDVLSIVSQPKSKESLLAPKHFDRILHRDCPMGAVADYNKCSSYAYLPLDHPTCGTKPAACSDDGHYLGLGVAK